MLHPFKALGVPAEMIQGLGELGIVTPTKTQEQVIPFLVQDGGDLITQAQRTQDAYHWLGHPECFDLLSVLKELRAAKVADLGELVQAGAESVMVGGLVTGLKIRPIKDTLGFTALIIRTVLYFNPLKVFYPVAFAVFLCLCGLLYYDLFVEQNLGDKTVLMFVAFVQAFVFCLMTMVYISLSTSHDH
jgi:hypothetical protein